MLWGEGWLETQLEGCLGKRPRTLPAEWGRTAGGQVQRVPTVQRLDVQSIHFLIIPACLCLFFIIPVSASTRDTSQGWGSVQTRIRARFEFGAHPRLGAQPRLALSPAWGSVWSQSSV